MLASTRLAPLAASLLLAAVSLHCTSESSFQCSDDSSGDCGDDGLCEPTGFCSFADDGCASGRRYGDLAESLSNQCVPPTTGTDGTDGPELPPSTGQADTEAPGTTDVDPTTGAASSDTLPETGSSSTSVGMTTGLDDTGSSSSDDTTTGGMQMCLLEPFDALPGKPNWFDFGDIAVVGGQLEMNVSPPSGNIAGFRTATPLDASSGSFTAVITELPALDVATTSFAMVDEVFDNQFGYAFGVINGVLRAEQTVDGLPPVVVDSATLEPTDLPVTLRFEVVGDTLEMTATTEGDAEPLLSYTTGVPTWIDDVYAALGAGNPSENDTMGVLRVDSIELCPGF